MLFETLPFSSKDFSIKQTGSVVATPMRTHAYTGFVANLAEGF
jgi:hypothetical protein